MLEVGVFCQILDKYQYLLPIEYSDNYLAFDNMPKSSNDGMEAIAMFDAFPDPVPNGERPMYSTENHPAPDKYLWFTVGFYDEYQTCEVDSQKYSKIIGDSEYYAVLYKLATSQRALYEFDKFVNFVGISRLYVKSTRISMLTMMR